MFDGEGNFKVQIKYETELCIACDAKNLEFFREKWAHFSKTNQEGPLQQGFLSRGQNWGVRGIKGVFLNLIFLFFFFFILLLV